MGLSDLMLFPGFPAGVKNGLTTPCGPQHLQDGKSLIFYIFKAFFMLAYLNMKMTIPMHLNNFSEVFQTRETPGTNFRSIG